MMDTIRPLQLSFNQRVLEQDNKFFFVASATLGINLLTGEELLETDYIKDAIDCMGDAPLPDLGMPKPNGEVLVSGKCFAPEGKSIPAQQVTIQVGSVHKSLYVFGDRFWKKTGVATRVITDPVPFTEMEILYQGAFGGEGFARNPSGKGFAEINDDSGRKILPLPNIEYPDRLIASPGDHPEPAGFGPLNPSWPQQTRFQGTYDDSYMKKYYPGYPADMDWRNFLSAPEDQWVKGFFEGNEPCNITNMHPEHRVIEGNLPSLYAR